MAKSFNVITNITNGAGLQRDYELVRDLLERAGHKVTGTMFNSPNPTFRRHDVNIFLEVVTPQWIQWAGENWIVPNTEWWYPVWDPFLPRMNRVLCKTQDCLRHWQKKAGPHRCKFIGWEAKDFFCESISRRRAFLHLACNSENKGTVPIAMAWRYHKLPYPLYITGTKTEVIKACAGIPNVVHMQRAQCDMIIQLMNECAFYLAPTRYEGYGMAIHEAIGCGSVVATTNAPPMNEFNGIARDLLIPVVAKNARLKAGAFFNEVDFNGVAAAVEKAAQLTDAQIADLSAQARAAFLADRAFFREQFKEIIG